MLLEELKRRAQEKLERGEPLTLEEFKVLMGEGVEEDLGGIR